MNGSDFVLGQRWVSNTEAELGLGIVAELENRRVVLSFPAVGERRTYALDNAPLSRVQYNIGEIITSDSGVSITVEERHEVDGCLVYLGPDESGEIKTIDEINLDAFAQFSRPLERMFAGQIDKLNAFSLRVDALDYHHRHACSPAFGLLGPRAQLLPHQFYIANEVGHRFHPRVLLADEVGLGKTIEAGLILHQQLLAGRVRRALIVVPETLIHQWLIEMLRRFNLQFAIVNDKSYDEPDEELLETDEPPAGSDNPFEAAQLVLCPLSALLESDGLFADACSAEWDMLVVDEAHHLHWHDGEPSEAYRRVESLAERAAGLLLITATPEQLGVEGHFARLRLLDPERFPDLQRFLDAEAHYLAVGELAERLRQYLAGAAHEIDDALVSDLSSFVSADLREALASRDDETAFRAALAAAFNQLLDQHGTGRVLFRNRRETVKGFPDRALHMYPLPAPVEYRTHADPLALLTPEQQYRETWLGFDPRIQWLVDWCARHRGDKVLVIAAFRNTAEALEEHLRVRHGIRSAVFHEGLDLIARDRAAAYFAEADDGADVLVCSEIGSEGRNFQFARHLVLFDLPFNPDLLEQRIGRLDRIGQTNTVEIHVPYFEATPSAVLFLWYHAGMNAFEEVCAVGPAMLELHGERLRQLMLAADDDALDAFINTVQGDVAATKQRLREGRDRLLEMNSCRPAEAANVVNQVRESTQALELADLMERLFDFFGVDQQASSSTSIVIHPGDHMLVENFPGLPEGGVTATYERTEALAREDMHFLTWEHPMVMGAIDMLINGEFGNATVCTLKAPFLKPGILFLEAIFVFQCSGPRELQLDRYLAQAARRVVVDSSGKDLSEILTSERFAMIASSVPKRAAQDVVKHARKPIEAMVSKAEQMLESAVREAIDNSISRLRAINGAEVARLRALAEVNDNVRPEEIAYFESRGAEIESYLRGARLRLDAVRVALST